MSPGRFVRTMLGAHGSRVAGRVYRSIFVDMAKASAAIAEEIPAGARVLDVGGGDGEPLNHLLDLRPDVTCTTIDVAEGVGRWIDARHLHRVTRIGSTSLQSYLDSEGTAMPDVVLMSDVIHHVPVMERIRFLAVVADVFRRAPRVRVIVKDVEPGHWRATLGQWSDRYVTGDRNVQLVSREALIEAMRRAHADLSHHETALFSLDPPNYALVFTSRPQMGGDGFAKKKGVSICSLPTGQGLCIKPNTARMREPLQPGSVRFDSPDSSPGTAS